MGPATLGGRSIFTGPKTNLILGLAITVFALALVFVWIPLDTDTGLVEKVRRQVTIGDSLAPTVAGLFLLIGGGLLMLFERNAPDQRELAISSLGFIGVLVALIALSLLVMRFTGPALVAVVNMAFDSSLEYRLLRDSVPWKYAGYFIGGTVLLTGMISLVEGRVGRRTVLIAVAAVIVLIAIYDLPFDDLLLPPNGDV